MKTNNYIQYDSLQTALAKSETNKISAIEARKLVIKIAKVHYPAWVPNFCYTIENKYFFPMKPYKSIGKEIGWYVDADTSIVQYVNNPETTYKLPYGITDSLILMKIKE